MLYYKLHVNFMYIVQQIQIGIFEIGYSNFCLKIDKRKIEILKS